MTGQGGVDKFQEGIFIGKIRTDPTGMDFGLSGRLQHIIKDSVLENFVLLVVHWGIGPNT
jgi:hypothetical protein